MSVFSFQIAFNKINTLNMLCIRHEQYHNTRIAIIKMFSRQILNTLIKATVSQYSTLLIILGYWGTILPQQICKVIEGRIKEKEKANIQIYCSIYNVIHYVLATSIKKAPHFQKWGRRCSKGGECFFFRFCSKCFTTRYIILVFRDGCEKYWIFRTYS